MIVNSVYHIGIYINKNMHAGISWKCNNCCYSDVNYVGMDCELLFIDNKIRPCHNIDIRDHSIYIIRSMLVDYDN